MSKNYILCVDDEKTVLSSLKQQLAKGLGGEYSFELAESGEEGLDIVNEILKAGHQLPVVISDQLMPGMKGDQFLVKVNAINPRTRKILLTGQASAQAVGNALNLADLYRFMSKPWQHEDLLNTVREAAKSYYQDHALEAKLRLLTQINTYGQLIAERIRLDEWSDAVLSSLVSDVEASRALLAVRNGTNGSTTTEYFEAIRRNGSVEVRRRDTKHLSEHFPLGVITEALAARQSVNLTTAHQDDDYSKDPVISARRIQSLYCSPIVHKDHTLGALYLDTADRPRQFQHERAELLSAVTAQSALALQHILLYQDLESKVKEQTQDIHEEHLSMRDSIFYASRIQHTMMPTEELIRQTFPESFILFRPKDIVSGDFYWFDVVDGAAYLCVADCTGHGVPGAFLTMLGMNLLDRIIRDQRKAGPGAILEALHTSYRKQLKQDVGSVLLDGMEIAICRIDLETREVRVGGANRPVYVCEPGGQLKKISTNRKGVGGKEASATDSFGEEVFTLSNGGCLYLLTDGLADQFSEDNKKKFTSKRLEELLVATSHLAKSEQGKAIESRFKLWKGKNAQTDDVLLLGIRVGG